MSSRNVWRVTSGILFGEFDRPTTRFVELVVIGFPFAADARAAVGDEPWQLGVIGESFSRLVERVFNGEDKQRMPARGVTAIKHDASSIVRAEAANEIPPGAREALSTILRAPPPEVEA